MLDWMINQRVKLFVIGVALALGAAYLGSQLQLDRSIEHMFAASNPVLAPYQKLQENFGQHQIAIAIYSEPELTDEKGLERVAKFTEEIRQVPGVVAAVSILDPPGAADFADTGRGKQLRDVFQGYTHNQQRNAAGVICLLDKSNKSVSKTIAQLRSIVNKLPHGTLVGEPILIGEAFDLLEIDGQRLNIWCTLLLTLAILLCFRSLRWLLLPIVVVQMTLALTRGLLVALGLQLSMVSSMLAAIVTVVGVATVVHIIVRYRDALLQGFSAKEALAQASKLVSVPIFFACLTDAAGFAALMISSVGPVQDFGLMMAIGSLLVLVSVFFAVPAIVLVGNDTDREDREPHDQVLLSKLEQLLNWSLEKKWLLLGLSAFITAAALIGSKRLVRETDFTRNFQANNPIVEGYLYVEEEFGGAGVWDIVIPVPRMLDEKFLERVLDLQKRLQEEVQHLNKAISIADVLDAMKPLGPRLALPALRVKIPEFVDAIVRPAVDEKQAQLRILLRSPERLEADVKARMIHQVRAAVTEEFPDASVTGYYVLLNELIESLLEDQWITFAVAAVAIALMMALAFRSLRLALVTLIPNSLPVLVLFGAMGWLGVRINMGAAMIAAVSLGLSVDGSIHYVMSYLRERRSGKTANNALHKVQATVGRAAVFATLALVIGFSTLCFSEFVPTIYFGALVSLSMIGGLFGNLILLPILIQAVDQ